MNGKQSVFIDQYGQLTYANTVKELRGKIGNGGSKVNLMYCVIKGKTNKVGYVIAGLWLSEYKAVHKVINKYEVKRNNEL